MSGTAWPAPVSILPAPGGDPLPRATPEPSSAGPVLLRRLAPPDLAAVERHLLALGPEDRRTRFLSRFGDAVISAYVRRIDPVAGILFGALDGPEGELLGLAEAYPTGAPDRVEVAVSVLPPHRRRETGAASSGGGWWAGRWRPASPRGRRWPSSTSPRRTWPWRGWSPRSAVASGKRRPNCIGAAEGRAASAATAVRPHHAMNVPASCRYSPASTCRRRPEGATAASVCGRDCGGCRCRNRHENRFRQQAKRRSGPFTIFQTVGHCWRSRLQAARAAKREMRVGASGRPANQAAIRSRLMAAAVATCCRPVLARPR